MPLSPEIRSEVVKLVSPMPISSENIFWGFNEVQNMNLIFGNLNFPLKMFENGDTGKIPENQLH